MSSREIHNQILDFLIKNVTPQRDYNWVSDFNSWDSSDCSEVGLVGIYLKYLVENQSDGVFGEKDDSISEIEQLFVDLKAGDY